MIYASPDSNDAGVTVEDIGAEWIEVRDASWHSIELKHAEARAVCEGLLRWMLAQTDGDSTVLKMAGDLTTEYRRKSR
jgi:hypothetical protein